MIRAIACLALWALTASAAAHDPRPLLVEIEPADDGRITLRWKTPASIDFAQRPLITLGGSCEPAGALVERRLRDAIAGERGWRCQGGAAGVPVEIRYRGANPSLATVIRVLPRDGGPPEQALLAPGETRWGLPVSEAGGLQAGEYFRLGVQHILGGIDHLLFLVCLMIVARGPRRVLIAATGFTIAHSLTLAMAALGHVSVPVAYVEAMIALSIVFMAAEIVRRDRGSLTWRYPGSVAFVFGLLHGFGFANVLMHLGFPRGQTLAALLYFNVGVEAGQILFLAGLFAVALLLRRSLSSYGRSATVHWSPVAVVIGIVAAYWTFERIAAFHGGP